MLTLFPWTGSSYLHTVWLNPSQAEESTKFNAYHRKLFYAVDHQLLSLGVLEEKYEKLLQTQNWPSVESILGVAHPQAEDQGSGMLDWKHCLVKWSGQEHEHVTWELSSRLLAHYPEAQGAFNEYVKQRRTEFCARHDAKYRVDLIRGRTQALGLQAGAPEQQKKGTGAIGSRLAINHRPEL